MKTLRTAPKSAAAQLRAAFTLIELLIVIVIIAILAGVAFPVTAMVMDSARAAEAKNEVKNLVNAVNMYKLEYGKLPLPNGSGGDVELITDSDNIIAVLSGIDVDGLNPREKNFYEAKRAKGVDQGQPRGGIYGSDDRLFLADPWGNPYWIRIDADYDGAIQGLPGMEGTDHRGEVAAWSEGKVKDDGVRLPIRKWHKSWE